MINQLLNQMKVQSSLDGGSKGMISGLVTSYDPANYAAKVMLQPYGVETGFLPVKAVWGGNGWGMFAPPTVGDMVDVMFQEDDHETGVIYLHGFNDTDRPLSVKSGEFWLVHKQGAFLKLTNDGKALINSSVEIDATAPVVNITAASSVNVTAPAINLGASGQSLLAFVTAAFMALFNSHTHTSSGSGSPTSAPNQSMGASHMTSTVKGG